MDKDALENMARELFYKNAAGWRNAVPWDELHEDTRQIYRDHVLLIDAIVSSEKLQPTPRTDAFYFPLGVDHSSMRHPDVLESVDFARQLERELTESEAERLEQARLLGMSAQLELKLRAELEAAQSAIAATGRDMNATEESCKGCGARLVIENAWMDDGCPCNTPAGVNNSNLYRWRLLHELQQRQARELEGKQAKIDALMLEYCPDEMTPQQIENWKNHQRVASQAEIAAIDAALASGSQSGAVERTTKK